MEIGLAIAALAVAGGAGAFAFWAARWAREEAGAVAVMNAANMDALHRISALTRDVKDRDDVITAKQLELDHLTAALQIAERQLADLTAAISSFAAARPEVLGAAVRAQLDRLRMVAGQAASVPAAPAPAAAGAGDGQPAVPGADPGGPIGDRLLPMA